LGWTGRGSPSLPAGPLGGTFPGATQSRNPASGAVLHPVSMKSAIRNIQRIAFALNVVFTLRVKHSLRTM
jgi:hypothetical protein